MTLSEARELIIAMVKDDAPKLSTPDDYDQCLTKALARYSRYRPRRLSQTITAGANGLILTSAITGFNEGYVDRMRIEYPINETSGKQTWLEPDEWEFQRVDDAGSPLVPIYVIRFFNGIAEAANVRIVHTVKHALSSDDADSLTVPESDVEAVCDLAASEALGMLARIYTQSSDGRGVQADIASFQNKSADYSFRAKTLRDQFDEHMVPSPMVA